MPLLRRLLAAGLAVLAVVLILLLVLGYRPWRTGPKPLILYGNVDIRQVDLAFRVGGRIAAMPVEEGVHVQAGETLARLDPQPLDDRLAAAQAQLELSTAQLDKSRNGNRPQDIAQAAAMLAQQQANLTRAKEDYDRRKALVMTGAVSQALFDQTSATYQAARAQVAAATQALSLMRAGSRREDIAAAVAQRDAARAQVAAIRTDLADSTLKAPSSGTILTRAREPGAIVQPGETVFTLTIDRPLRVRAYVAEPDLSRIAPGMAVRVTADGNAHVYHGTIGFIAPTAEFTPKTVETESLRSDLVYRLRVIVSDPDGALRQGQPVTVAIPGARPAPR